MFVYGLYGLLFLVGGTILFLLFFSHQAEKGFQWIEGMDLQQFLLLFILLFLFLIGSAFGGLEPLFEGNLPILFGGLFVLILPSFLVFLLQAMQKPRSVERRKIEGLKKQAQTNPQDPAPYLSLARIYEKLGRMGDAIHSYQKVYELYSELGYRSKFQRKIESLQPLWEREEREKSLECRVCHVNNYPKRYYCEECGSSLYQNIARWVFDQLPLKLIGVNLLVLLFIFFNFRIALGFALLLFPVYLSVYLFVQKKKTNQQMKMELKENFKSLKRELARDPNNPVIHRSLSNLYEKNRRFGMALQEAKKAYALVSEDLSGYREKLEREIEVLKSKEKMEEKEKTLQCPSCGTNNLPKMKNCEECDSPLYKNFFAWANSNFDKRGKMLVLIIPLLFSPFLIWLPIHYYLSLTLIWLIVSLYFFYPHVIHTS